MSTDPNLKKYVKNYKRILKKCINLAKRMFNNSKIEKSKNKIKTIWQMVKQETIIFPNKPCWPVGTSIRLPVGKGNRGRYYVLKNWSSDLRINKVCAWHLFGHCWSFQQDVVALSMCQPCQEGVTREDELNFVRSYFEDRTCSNTATRRSPWMDLLKPLNVA